LPFLDESGILSSKSRLANVDYLSYEVRYPVLLDKQEPLTKLIISSVHYKFVQTIGNSCCKAEIHKGYVIIYLDNTLKSVRSKCLVCQKHLATPIKRQMSDLPSWRFEKHLKAFANCGLDFAGPFDQVEEKLGRKLTFF
jgi:hypothetical protein